MTCVCFAKLSFLGVTEPLLTKKRRFERELQGKPVLGYFFSALYTCINLYNGNFPLLEVAVPVITKNVVLSRSSRESMKSHGHASWKDEERSLLFLSVCTVCVQYVYSVCTLCAAKPHRHRPELPEFASSEGCRPTNYALIMH